MHHKAAFIWDTLGESWGGHYVFLNPVEDPDISNESFDYRVKRTTDKLIISPVKSFDKPNEYIHFEVEKNTVKSFGNLPPKLVEKILITKIRRCDNTCPSHIVYTFNSLRNVCNFWGVILEGPAIIKLLPQVYVWQDILPKPKKNGEVQVKMQIGYRSQENTEHREMEQSLD